MDDLIILIKVSKYSEEFLRLHREGLLCYGIGLCTFLLHWNLHYFELVFVDQILSSRVEVLVLRISLAGFMIFGRNQVRTCRSTTILLGSFCCEILFR